MNVTRASRTGKPDDPIYFLMTVAFVPFLFFSFMGTVFGIYSGGVWIALVVIYIIVMIYYGAQ